MRTGIGVTISNGIVAGEDGATAVEVVAARRDPFSRRVEDGGIKSGGPGDVTDRENDAVRQGGSD